MKIPVERMIKEGDIGPLRWGMSGDDIARVLPGSLHRIREFRAAQCPFLHFDGIEFYFDQDFYQGLSGFVIRARAIRPNAPTRYFDLGWISQRLTYRKVLGNLQRLGWAYLERRYVCLRPFPVILAEDRAIFVFEDDEEVPEGVPPERYKLQKIYLEPGGVNDYPHYSPAH